MVDEIALINAQVDTFRRIPELVAALADDPANIQAYIDSNPDKASIGSAIYSQKPGTILVVWQETLLQEGEIEAWVHRFQYFFRAGRGQSPLALMALLMNGVPNPGDGLRWRYCPVMNGVLPTVIAEQARLQDSEGIDYYAVTATIQETGDI